eukprot:5146315-Amphidinium_carterae.1
MRGLLKPRAVAGVSPAPLVLVDRKFTLHGTISPQPKTQKYLGYYIVVQASRPYLAFITTGFSAKQQISKRLPGSAQVLYRCAASELQNIFTSSDMLHTYKTRSAS